MPSWAAIRPASSFLPTSLIKSAPNGAPGRRSRSITTDRIFLSASEVSRDSMAHEHPDTKTCWSIFSAAFPLGVPCLRRVNRRGQKNWRRRRDHRPYKPHSRDLPSPGRLACSPPHKNHQRRLKIAQNLSPVAITHDVRYRLYCCASNPVTPAPKKLGCLSFANSGSPNGAFGRADRVKGPYWTMRGRQNLKCVRPDLEARMRAAGHEGRRRGFVHDDWL
jgi:hypothetical protein